MEHRWGERVAVGIPVRLHWSHEHQAEGRLINVSDSGGCVKTSARPPLLVVVEFDRLLCGCGSATNLVPGWVTRSDSETIGIEWSEFAPDLIRQIISQATATSADPSLAPALAATAIGGAPPAH